MSARPVWAVPSPSLSPCTCIVRTASFAVCHPALQFLLACRFCALCAWLVAAPSFPASAPVHRLVDVAACKGRHAGLMLIGFCAIRANPELRKSAPEYPIPTSLAAHCGNNCRRASDGRTDGHAPPGQGWVLCRFFFVSRFLFYFKSRRLAKAPPCTLAAAEWCARTAPRSCP
jgi:hypothetical protein